MTTLCVAALLVAAVQQMRTTALRAVEQRVEQTNAHNPGQRGCAMVQNIAQKHPEHSWDAPLGDRRRRRRSCTRQRSEAFGTANTQAEQSRYAQAIQAPVRACKRIRKTGAGAIILTPPSPNQSNMKTSHQSRSSLAPSQFNPAPW